LNREKLATYLNDHRAGATGAMQLLERAIEQNRGTEFEPFLDHLLQEIQHDVQVLEGLMDKLGIEVDRFKRVVAWVGEKAARAKLSLPIGGYSASSRLLQLEALTTGVTGKLSLWQVLHEVSGDPALTGFDAERYIARAQEQLAGLEENRRRAAKLALTR
jgi:hypothetical protein